MMVPEVDMSGELGPKLEVSPVSIKEIGGTMKLPEEELVVCASNCEDHAFVDDFAKIEEKPVMACASSFEDDAFHTGVSVADCDQATTSKSHDEDVEVEIVENVIPDEELGPERESLDATENSSSFGCTDSGTGTAGASSDVEVESHYSHLGSDDASLMDFDGVNDLFKTRKKKLTAHWRNYVRPIMWRCKWIELQIKELDSQASKYDRELAECSRRKQCEREKSAAEDLAIKSIPVCQDQPVKIMKRKKRRRVEETTNLAAYSSCHKVFSYFASKRLPVDAAYLGDDHGSTGKTSGSGEFGVNDEFSFLEFKDSDAFESILRKIEETQIHINQLRLRLDKVVRENAELTSGNSRSAPGEPLASCGPSSILPLVNGENFPVGSQATIFQHTSQKLVMTKNVVSGCMKVNPCEMIETNNQLYVGRKCDKIKNENLVCNQTIKEEPDSGEVLGIERNVKNVLTVSDPNSPSKMAVSRDQSGGKARSKLATPKNKKKRGRRKARTGRWSRRSSGSI